MTITLPAGLTAETRTLSGWGRTNPVAAQGGQPSSVEQLQELIRGAPPRLLIARGLGRSYGDATQLKDGTVIELPAFDRIELDAASGTVTAGAGVSLDQILRVIVPAGFFLPVTPGTRNVTVGGAIAADVHGKNHHVEGSFGNHVQRLLLVDGTGTLRFALVNLLAVLQTWLVSVGLRNWLLPILGVVAFRDLIAHGCGVAVPVLSSYFGHKHISFRNRF